MATHHPGISAVQLKRQLGIARYDTAWLILHKLRRAMVAPERDPLTGPVEVDDFYVGGIEEGRGGGAKDRSSKAIVAAAIELRGKGSGRLRLGVVSNVSAGSLCGFVTEVVDADAVVHTDGWQAYRHLGRLGYEHRRQANARRRPASGSCPACTARSPTSRPGCTAPTATSGASTCRSTWTSSSFATTAGAHRWRPS
ncbi:MAG TPA: IS1595 family transposase, partial [Baekduia sp.]|nr:IS1595 family transposase [Baekduia sp.]